jgi:hypothetical protein
MTVVPATTEIINYMTIPANAVWIIEMILCFGISYEIIYYFDKRSEKIKSKRKTENGTVTNDESKI